MNPSANLRLRRAARAVKGALGRFFDKIGHIAPAGSGLPPGDYPLFPPY